MARRRVYVDTSAYLCVVLGEKGHAELGREFSGAILLSCVLLVLEVTRNLVRLSREGLLSASDLEQGLARLDADVERFVLRDVTLDICGGRLMPLVSTPRSLDLLHLRTAIWFHERERIDRFVTLDERQATAARELGLPA